MALKDVVKISRKTFFNPSGWLGYDSLKFQTRTIIGIAKAIFSPAAPPRQETFAQAMKRLRLTEEDIQKSQQGYFLSALIFMACGVATLLISFYLLFQAGTFSGWILGLVTTSLFFTYAFRAHFLYFQIKHRKLGCTLKEWRSGKIIPNEERRTP